MKFSIILNLLRAFRVLESVDNAHTTYNDTEQHRKIDNDA